MAHDIQANTPHSIVTVKLAIAAICGDTIADGLNQLLNPEIGEGFIADYALLHTHSPLIVHSSDEPEEGELFNDAGTWMVVIHQDVGVTDYHRVDTAVRLDTLKHDELKALLSPKFDIEDGAAIDVFKIETTKRHVL